MQVTIAHETGTQDAFGVKHPRLKKDVWNDATRAEGSKTDQNLIAIRFIVLAGEIIHA
jgi:hypothetical protein